MSYELWELRRPWPHGEPKALLFVTLRSSAETLMESVGVPIEVDLIDYVPELIDPTLAPDDTEGFAFVGIWCHRRKPIQSGSHCFLRRDISIA